MNRLLIETDRRPIMPKIYNNPDEFTYAYVRPDRHIANVGLIRKSSGYHFKNSLYRPDSYEFDQQIEEKAPRIVTLAESQNRDNVEQEIEYSYEETLLLLYFFANPETLRRLH